MSYLPAPYESAQQDDLSAALAAGLAAVTAGITSWITGRAGYDVVRLVIDDAVARKSGRLDLPPDILVPGFGWAISVVFMVIGIVLLAFRRGRGALTFGALISVATTAIAQFLYHYGTSPPIDQWPLYWGGLVVLVAALLPATGRWVNRSPSMPGPPTTGMVTGSGPTLWPGT